MTILVGKPLSWAITTTAGSGFLLFGYDQGVMSGLLTGTAFTQTFPEIDTTATGHGSSSLQGTVTAIYEIGCFFGAIIALLIGERIGRRWCIIAGCIILSIGAALQCSAYSIPHLIVGRIVAGVGNGLNTSTIPVWHSELSKAASRGKGLQLAIELCINIFGVMTAYWVAYGMSYVVNDAQFRFPIALQILFAVITLAGIIVLPESPRWLIAHGRHDEARHVIWAVQPNARLIDEDDAAVTADVTEITTAIAEEREATQEGSFKLVFTNGHQKFFYRTLLGMGGQMMQQLSGVNLITYYNTVIFEDSVGMSHNLALLMAGFNGVAYFASTFVPIWAIDRLGRRKLMLFAAAGQCACMAILAGTVYDGSHASGIVATVMLFLFNFFFGVGLLAIPWLLPAEYAPLSIRSQAAALATATNWIFTFLVVEITPVSIKSIGYRTYIYFAVDRLFTGEKVQLHWHASMGAVGDASERVDEKTGKETVEHGIMDEASQPIELQTMPCADSRHLPRKRTRTGCVNCSRRRRKCDEAKPTCTGCKRRGDKCQWRMLGSFREANIKVLEPGHPSMNQTARGTRKQSKFKILNVVPSPSRAAGKERQLSPPVDEGRGSSPSARSLPGNGEGESEVVRRDGLENVSGAAPDAHPTVLSPGSNQAVSPLSHHSFHAQEINIENGHSPHQANELPHPYPDEAPHQPYIHSSPEFVVNELTALRNLSNNTGHFPGPEVYQSMTSPLFDHSVFSDPANLTNDVFVPGSAYEALHTTLRNRQLWTARTEIPSRASTPASVLGYDGPTPNTSRIQRSRRAQSRPGRDFELTPERENILWQNYLNEICLWLDMFDNHRHFASTFPQMAKSAPHLRYSILALSARQMERQQNKKSQSESLFLYQEAIHQLLPELEQKTTPVIASCVILCVLEMLSCLGNPKEWRRHLDGCAYLIQAAEINGFSGKEEQALFWCFARMDVCGGLISEEETIIPINHWIPRDMTPTEASQLFLASNMTTFDTYANYTVFLCAQTLGVLFGGNSQLPASCMSCHYLSSPREGESFRKPALPCLCIAFAATKTKDGIPASATEIGVVARAANLRYFRIEYTPPLWLAGKVMSHHSEHTAIIETLTRIERETGGRQPGEWKT
ncbi:MFS sugar transporter [Aspergillus eucalypticola CBS 122712]|uniref:MFS sugar transporter n=1 Tax=Aspergillus eucalypticola (strain CBS 122712 / IBT 29274) TaxID=1448314 RepID=A0A317VBJ5_ASPEC|nr:MFS sugar transporter [Aspergillus eucalypticola CBS 122712]PWY70621.1 MFS sugar transporter [Aspergillus eucalypticola CBS 122712]